MNNEIIIKVIEYIVTFFGTTCLLWICIFISSIIIWNICYPKENEEGIDLKKE